MVLIVFVIWAMFWVVLRLGRDAFNAQAAEMEESINLSDLDDESEAAAGNKPHGHRNKKKKAAGEDDDDDDDDGDSDSEEEDSRSGSEGSGPESSIDSERRSDESSSESESSSSSSSDSDLDTREEPEPENLDPMAVYGPPVSETQQRALTAVGRKLCVFCVSDVFSFVCVCVCVCFLFLFQFQPPESDFTYKLKIFLGFLQILTNISSGLEIQWPNTFKDFVLVFDVVG